MGCGASTRFRDRAGDAALWTPDLFAAELDNLIRTLGIERFDLLGQSWGGMLATWFVTQGRWESARGLRKLVICDSLASFETWMKVSKELRAALPAETRAVLDRCEAAGETEGNQEYEAAVTEFNRRHQCRLDPLPVELEEAFVAWMEDATVQMTMFGPSDWDISGSLRGFSIEGELCKLTKERVPGGLLLVNGQFDIAQDECMRPFWREATTKTKWVRFALSAHAPQLEETETFIFELGSFLNSN
ncbi:Alpha/Beta hydrolase protein [Mycena galopus ATCC 62051]|nr:Alpha/Beta hydrolase protein [Mycena galopus ATCC 62051]